MSTGPTDREWAFELRPMTSAERKSPEQLRCFVGLGTEALGCAVRLVLSGEAGPTPEVLAHLLQVVSALRQRLQGRPHDMLPDPIVGPGGSMQVDPTTPGSVQGLCELACASAKRPLMSVEAQAVLADLGPQALAAMESEIARFDVEVQRLMRVTGSNPR